MPETIEITKNPETREIALQAAMSAGEKDVLEISLRLFTVNPEVRARGISLVRKLSPGWKVTKKKRQRSKDQNALMWVLLTWISKAEPLGRKETPETWKLIMMHACKFETQFEIGLNGKPFATGMSTSNLTVGQMSTLIQFIYWFIDDNDIYLPPENKKENIPDYLL